MARKGWGSLTPNYRQRLEKAGINQSDYEQGVSLEKARGHERTPEHPLTPGISSKADRTKYPQYFREHSKLIRQLQDKKEEFFGSTPRWDERRSDSNIRRKPLGNSLLRKVLNMTAEEMIDALREDPETFYFLGYH